MSRIIAFIYGLTQRNKNTLDKCFATEAFKSLDTDSDGVVSLEEFVKMCESVDFGLYELIEDFKKAFRK